MALSIGVSAGDRINVGGHRVRVKAIVNPMLIVLKVDDDKEFLISDKENTEILPDVRVFAGIGRRSVGNRLGFIAPKRIAIVRDEG
jgi:hypothetical protein